MLAFILIFVFVLIIIRLVTGIVSDIFEKDENPQKKVEENSRAGYGGTTVYKNPENRQAKTKKDFFKDLGDYTDFEEVK